MLEGAEVREKNGIRIGVSLTGIRGNVVRAAEDLESGITLDTVRRAQISLFGAIDLRQVNVLVFEGSGCLFIFGE